MSLKKNVTKKSHGISHLLCVLHLKYGPAIKNAHKYEHHSKGRMLFR